MLSRPLSLVSITFLAYQKVFACFAQSRQREKRHIWKVYQNHDAGKARGCFFFEDKLCQFVYIKPQGTTHTMLKVWFFFYISGSNVIPSVASLDITHAASRQTNHTQNHYDDEPHAWIRVEREKLQKFACKRSRHGRWLPVSDTKELCTHCTI